MKSIKATEFLLVLLINLVLVAAVSLAQQEDDTSSEWRMMIHARGGRRRMHPASTKAPTVKSPKAPSIRSAKAPSVGKGKGGKGKGGGNCPCFTPERLLEVAPIDGSLTYDQEQTCNTNINGQRVNVRIIVQGDDLNNRPAQIRRGRRTDMPDNPSDADGAVDCFARDQDGPAMAPTVLGQLPDEDVEDLIEACNQILYDHCLIMQEAGVIPDTFDELCTKEDFDRHILEAETGAEYTDCAIPPPPPTCCWDAAELERVAPSDPTSGATYDNTRSCIPDSNGLRATIRITRTDVASTGAQMQRGRDAVDPSNQQDTDGEISCFTRTPIVPRSFIGNIITNIPADVVAQTEACNQILFDHCTLLQTNGLITNDFSNCMKEDFDLLLVENVGDNNVCPNPPPPP
jgi:hypothetical protein